MNTRSIFSSMFNQKEVRGIMTITRRHYYGGNASKGLLLVNFMDYHHKEIAGSVLYS
jgi:hypothetical protein